MDRKSLRKSLVVAAMTVAIAGAVLGARARTDPPPTGPAFPPAAIEPFDLARVLTQAPSDVVVVSFESARHPLNGAIPVETFGDTDEAFVLGAPKARRIVLVGKDPIRVDRIARRLMASGRTVAVLAGGLEGWDKAMDADPAAPPDQAGAEVWNTYRMNVALRRYFGDASAAALPAVAPRPAVVPAAGGGAPKKREGC